MRNSAKNARRKSRGRNPQRGRVAAPLRKGAARTPCLRLNRRRRQHRRFCQLLRKFRQERSGVRKIGSAVAQRLLPEKRVPSRRKIDSALAVSAAALRLPIPAPVRRSLAHRGCASNPRQRVPSRALICRIEDAATFPRRNASPGEIRKRSAPAGLNAVIPARGRLGIRGRVKWRCCACMAGDPHG